MDGGKPAIGGELNIKLEFRRIEIKDYNRHTRRRGRVAPCNWKRDGAESSALLNTMLYPNIVRRLVAGLKFQILDRGFGRANYPRVEMWMGVEQLWRKAVYQVRMDEDR